MANGFEEQLRRLMASMPKGYRHAGTYGRTAYGQGSRPAMYYNENPADTAARQAASAAWGQYEDLYGGGDWGGFQTPYNQEWINKAVATRVTGPATTAARAEKLKLQQRLASIGNVSGAPSAMKQIESQRTGAIQSGSTAIELAAQAANFAAQERARSQFGGALLQRSWDVPGQTPGWGGMPGMGGGVGAQQQGAGGGAGWQFGGGAERGWGNAGLFSGGGKSEAMRKLLESARLQGVPGFPGAQIPAMGRGSSHGYDPRMGYINR